MTIKERINEAFRLMRREGLFARQNYWCCRGCAGCAASQAIEERQAKGKTIIGCCYTTQQDCEVFKDDGLDRAVKNILRMREALAMLDRGETAPEWGTPEWYAMGRVVCNWLGQEPKELRAEIARQTKSCGVYLGFSGVDQPDGTETDCTEVGRTVVRCLNECGVKTKWNGSSMERIYIPLLQDVVS